MKIKLNNLGETSVKQQKCEDRNIAFSLVFDQFT